MHRLPWQSIPEIRRDTSKVMYALVGTRAASKRGAMSLRPAPALGCGLPHDATACSPGEPRHRGDRRGPKSAWPQRSKFAAGRIR